MQARSTRSFLSLASMVLAFSYADYGFQFLYQMTLGRLLSVDDYGVYSALLSMNLVFSIFSAAFPLLAVRSISEAVAHDPSQFWPSLNGVLRRLTGPLILFAALVVAFSGSAKEFFHLQVAWPIWLVTATCVLSSYQNTLLAALQSLQLYRLSSMLIFSFTLMRFILGALLIYFLQASYWGIYLGLLIANLIEIIWILWLLKRRAPRPNSQTPREFQFAGWQSAVLISLSMASLIGLDTSFARHFLEPEQAGLYSAASQVAKIVMLVSNPFLALIIPEVTRARVKVASAWSLRHLVLLALAVTLGALVIVCFFPKFMLSFMLGEKFVGAAVLVPTLAVATSCAAVIAMANNYFFALNKPRYFYLLFGLSLTTLIAILAWFHTTALQLASAVMGGSILITVFAVGTLVVSRQRYLK